MTPSWAGVVVVAFLMATSVFTQSLTPIACLPTTDQGAGVYAGSCGASSFASLGGSFTVASNALGYTVLGNSLILNASAFTPTAATRRLVSSATFLPNVTTTFTVTSIPAAGGSIVFVVALGPSASAASQSTTNFTQYVFNTGGFDTTLNMVTSPWGVTSTSSRVATTSAAGNSGRSTTTAIITTGGIISALSAIAGAVPMFNISGPLAVYNVTFLPGGNSTTVASQVNGYYSSIRTVSGTDGSGSYSLTPLLNNNSAATSTFPIASSGSVVPTNLIYNSWAFSSNMTGAVVTVTVQGAGTSFTTTAGASLPPPPPVPSPPPPPLTAGPRLQVGASLLASCVLLQALLLVASP